MKKRILSIVLALILTATITAPASAANTQRFTDVSPDDWYYEAVNAMAEAGIVSGIGDGRFEPNRSMTAGELATVLWNMMYGDWCKGTELYQTYTNGYAYGLTITRKPPMTAQATATGALPPSRKDDSPSASVRRPGTAPYP